KPSEVTPSREQQTEAPRPLAEGPLAVPVAGRPTAAPSAESASAAPAVERPAPAPLPKRRRVAPDQLPDLVPSRERSVKTEHPDEIRASRNPEPAAWRVMPDSAESPVADAEDRTEPIPVIRPGETTPTIDEDRTEILGHATEQVVAR